MSSSLTGSRVLLLVALRRDRTQLSVWVLGLAGFISASAAVMGDLFASQRELEQTLSILASNPVMRAFGLPSGATVGSLVMLRTLAFIAVLVALMSVMAVTRHTRQNEETRRAELIGSTAVGRHAALMAALLTAGIANVALAVAVAVGLTLAGLDTRGAAAAGAALGAVGMAFAAIAAVAAQVSSSSRGATGLASIGIGVAFLLSSTGNVLGSATPDGFVVESAWPAWLSPIGWAQQMRPFGGDHWEVLALFAAFTAATVALAVTLERRRDVGRGMMPERRGPSTAPSSLLSPLGLAWRLHRGTFIGWAVGVTVFGAVFGAVSNAFEDIISEVEEAAEFFARIGGTEQLTEGFYAAILGLMATVIALHTIGGLLRMHGEEADGLLEPLLATSVSRQRWMMSHVVVVAGATLALLVFAGTSAGVLVGLMMGDLTGQVTSLVVTALVQAPAVLLLGGVALLSFAVTPRRAAAISWLAFTLALVTGPMFGGLLDLPQWAMNASPFTHVPRVPAEPFAVLPVLVLSGIAAALGALAFVAFSRRDLDLHAGEGAAAFEVGADPDGVLHDAA